VQPQGEPEDNSSTKLAGLMSTVGRASGPARRLLPWITIGLALYIVGLFVPEGYDWRLNLGAGNPPPWWVPWSRPILLALNPASIFALTITSMAARAYGGRRSVIGIALAVVSLPTLWVLHLGEVSGLTVLGLLLLPWGVPLVLLKPQIAAFSLLANRKWFIAACVWLLVSFAIWGFWPLRLLVVQGSEWKATYPQDITLFPWGLLVAVPLLWLSRRDEDLLMAAGSLATPHLFPYHFIVLMPALSRMQLRWAVATWIVTWLPLLANWLGPTAWHFGNLASVFFWLGLRFGAEDRVRSPWSSGKLLGEQ
jgi:hypothetical protein